MACCRRSPKNTTILQQVAAKRRSVGVIAPKVPKPPVDRRLATTAAPTSSILCNHFEQQGSSLLVDVTPERKILFKAAGGTFNLEENIELYGCTGKVPILVKAVRRNLDELTVAPTPTQVKLGSLLANTIELLKKEI